MKALRTSALLAFLTAFLPTLFISGCEGTSSGVDNPSFDELTVSFRDGSGAALRVTGDLDVYGADQNPAVNPEPLATVKVRNSALTNLTGRDFDRINTTTRLEGGGATAAKASASRQPVAPADSPVAFNLIFRSDAGKGSLAFGLRYDPVKNRFERQGGTLARIDLPTRPLVRYQALIRREAVHGDLGRVFIPGTPFQATLDDTVFIFEALPEGTFPLRLLGADGRIFAVRESLDTKTGMAFTPEKTPIGTLDTSDTTSRPPVFSVEVPEKLEAMVGLPTVLEAKVVGVALDSLGARASILWRQVRSESPDSAVIHAPTHLQTQVKFRTPGVYAFEIAVTVGSHTARDTVVYAVREAPPPTRARVVQPKAGDTLYIGAATKISWEMPVKGRATIQLSIQGGEYRTLAENIESLAGLSFFAWTPHDSLLAARDALIRVKLETDTLVALMEKPFFLIIKPL